MTFVRDGKPQRYGYLEPFPRPASRARASRQRVACPDCGDVRDVSRTPETVARRGPGPLVLCWWCLPPDRAERESYADRRWRLAPGPWMVHRAQGLRQRAFGEAS